MQTQAFFFFWWGRGFRSALIVGNICKDKQETTFFISCFSSAYPEISGLLFIHERPGKQITEGGKGRNDATAALD